MTSSKPAKIHICGVTCHRGDANCNGYCHDPKVPHAKLIEAVPVTDATIETEIQAKGLTAPRVTPAALQANIVREHYFTAAQGAHSAWLNEPRGSKSFTADDATGPLSLLTFCVLTLRNGFTVTGESACASPENFDPEIGRKIARQNAEQKIWPLMGYQLRETLAQKR